MKKTFGFRLLEVGLGLAAIGLSSITWNIGVDSVVSGLLVSKF